MNITNIYYTARLYDVPNSTTAPYPLPKRTICHRQPDDSCKTVTELAVDSLKAGWLGAKKVGAAASVVKLADGKAIFQNDISLDILRSSGSFLAVKTARNMVNAATDNVGTRAGAAATLHAVRKAYLGEGRAGIGIGAAQGVGYTLLGEAKENLDKNGHTELGEFLNAAGTYTIEMASATAKCFSDRDTPCRRYLAQGVVIATALLVAV